MSEEKKDWDVGRLGPPTPHGQLFLRCRGGRHEVATLCPVKEGENLASSGGELVSLTPHEDGSSIFDVETLYGGTGEAGGPAMVNSDSYRTGWDAIFSQKSQEDSALN